MGGPVIPFTAGTYYLNLFFKKINNYCYILFI